MLRVVVVEPDAGELARLRGMLRAARVEVAAECGDAASGMAAVAAHDPDLVLLAVELPDRSGLDVAAELTTGGRARVVLLSPRDHAVRAFEAGAMGYLLKPFTAERLSAVLARAHPRRDTLPAQAEHVVAVLRELRASGQALLARTAAEPGRYLHRFCVKSGDRGYFVAVAEVRWIQSSANYATLHAGGRPHLVRVSLRELMARLDPARFVRTSRSTLVNLDYVAEIRRRPGGDYALVLKDGTELRFSRVYWRRLSGRLDARIPGW